MADARVSLWSKRSGKCGESMNAARIDVRLVVRATHETYSRRMHRDYTRVINGRKHALIYDANGCARWVPVIITPREEVLTGELITDGSVDARG